MAGLPHRCAALTVLAALLTFQTTAAVADHKVRDDQQQSTIVVGRVSDDPVKHLPRLQAMADYLARQLAPLGITKGEAVVARDNAEMVTMLRSGRVDVMSETVMSALYFEERAGTEILLREWKKGVASYASVIFARTSDGISSLADLRGRRVAFEDPGSTSGFLVPLATLREAGLDLVPLRSPRDTPPADRVGYVFTGAEVNVAAMVSRGVVDAGAFSDSDWNDPERAPDSMRQHMSIIARSAPILRSTVSVRGDMAPALRDALRATLLAIADDPAAQDVRKAYWKVSRYDEISGDVAEQLEQMRVLFALLGNRIS